MFNLRFIVFTTFIIQACVILQMPDAASEIPSLDDYPPKVVARVMADFDERKSALLAEGAPADKHGLAGWGACASEVENAYGRYLNAFESDRPSEKRALLQEATALPCFHYPVRPKKLSRGPNTDYLRHVLDSARILANEAVLCAGQGNAEASVTMLESGFRFLEHQATSPFTLVQLTRYACQRILVEATEACLATQALTPGQLRRIQTAVDAALVPDALPRAWHLSSQIDNTPTPFDYMPTIYITDAESQAQLRGLSTVLAVERYHAHAGKFPPSLKSLVPDYCTAVPLDPFSGAPLTYVLGENHYAVGSVGPDGTLPESLFEISKDAYHDQRNRILMPRKRTPRPFGEMPWLPTDRVEHRTTRSEKKAIHIVYGTLANTPWSDEGQTPSLEVNVLVFLAGPLDGGIAVLLESASNTNNEVLPIMAAFWVQGDRVYTVNDWARDLAPALEAAPATITLDAVRDVAR